MIPVQMPALSPTMKEGKITRWIKKKGDQVASGEAIAECETDKSNLEIEAYDDGVLLEVLVKEGESAPVGAPIAYIGAAGETVPATPPVAAPASAPAATPAPATAAAPAPAAQVLTLRPLAAGKAGRLRASPLARKMATEQGLDLVQVHGSGPQGRIVKRDVEAALTRPTTPEAPLGRAAPVAVPLSGMRKVIAQRMAEVKPGVPHFYLTVDVEMDAALQIRAEAKEVDSHVSVNDIVVKAVALALKRSPKMNVSFAGDHVLQYQSVDVGVAVAVEDGLITPVIRDADHKGLDALAEESRALAERARKRALKPDEYAGGSITVSNLGMFGIDAFVAVINPPQASILAVGAVADRAVVRDGQLAVRKMMTVTLSGDHRVIDGATGAQYLKELKALLEHPLRLLL